MISFPIISGLVVLLIACIVILRKKSIIEEGNLYFYNAKFILTKQFKIIYRFKDLTDNPAYISMASISSQNQQQSYINEINNSSENIPKYEEIFNQLKKITKIRSLSVHVNNDTSQKNSIINNLDETRFII